MPSDDLDERSWPEYRRLVLNELERIDRALGALNMKLDAGAAEKDKGISDLRVNVAMLQVKCGMWGALSGLGAALAVVLLRSGIGHL